MQSVLSEALALSVLAAGAAAWPGTSGQAEPCSKALLLPAAWCVNPELGLSGKNRHSLAILPVSSLPPSSGGHAPKYFLRSGDGTTDQTF